MNRYFKHFILCGDIDQYCLLCKKTFRRIPDIESHVKGESHKELEKELTYVKKYETEFIYKISGKFYCELCNHVTPHMTSLKDHIKSMRHSLLKEKPEAVIKKPSGLYIAGEVIIDRKVLLNRFEWNTIGDQLCLLCDADITDIDEHIATEDHMIALIQSEITYGDNRYYRKIQEDLYHCFTCKKVFSTNILNAHWPKCINTDEKMINKFKDSKNHIQFDAFLDDIRMVQKEHEVMTKFEEWYILDHSNNIAVCKTCYTPIPTCDEKFKSMIEHLKEHILTNMETQSNASSSATKSAIEEIFVDHGKKRKQCAAYGRTQGIVLNNNGTRGYCRLCDRYICVNMNAFEEHCDGLIHLGHREMLGLIEKIDRPPVEYRSQSITSFLLKLAYAPFKLTVYINNDFFLNFFSLFLMKRVIKNPDFKKTKCFACSEYIAHGDEREHCLASKHQEVFMNAKVLSKPGEFIREIRPNLFHCAFCNIILPYTNTLERHIRSIQHTKSIINKLPVANMMQHCRDLEITKVRQLGESFLYVFLLGFFFEDYTILPALPGSEPTK